MIGFSAGGACSDDSSLLVASVEIIGCAAIWHFRTLSGFKHAILGLMNGGTLRLTGHICQKAWLDVSLGCVEGCGSRCMQDLDAILQRSRSAIQRSILHDTCGDTESKEPTV